MNIGLNIRVMFVGAIVVGGDAASAKVHPLTHRRVPQVGQVVSFGACGQGGVLDLDKIADMHVGTQVRAGPQSRKGPNTCAKTDCHALRLAVNVCERVDHCAGLNDCVGNHAVGTDGHTLAQIHLPLKHTIHIDTDIVGAKQISAHIDARRVSQAHALFHQTVCLLQLVGTLQSGQLHRAIDAGHLHGVLNFVRHHRHTIGHRELHDVGEVELPLHVVVVQALQPPFQLRSRHSHDAAVSLGDDPLRDRCILVFHDGQHITVGHRSTPHNASITRGINHLQGQQRQLGARTRGDQVEQGGGPGQGHIARQHHHDAVVGQHRHRLLHGVPGPQLRLLAHKLYRKRACSPRIYCASCFYFDSTVTGDHHRLAGLQRTRRV